MNEIKLGSKVKLVFDLQSDYKGEPNIPAVGDIGIVNRFLSNGDLEVDFFSIADGDGWVLMPSDVELQDSNNELRQSADEAGAAALRIKMIYILNLVSGNIFDNLEQAETVLGMVKANANEALVASQQADGGAGVAIVASGSEGERKHPAPCGYPEYLCSCEPDGGAGVPSPAEPSASARLYQEYEIYRALKQSRVEAFMTYEEWLVEQTLKARSDWQATWDNLQAEIERLRAENESVPSVTGNALINASNNVRQLSEQAANLGSTVVSLSDENRQQAAEIERLTAELEAERGKREQAEADAAALRLATRRMIDDCYAVGVMPFHMGAAEIALATSAGADLLAKLAATEAERDKARARVGELEAAIVPFVVASVHLRTLNLDHQLPGGIFVGDVLRLATLSK